MQKYQRLKSTDQVNVGDLVYEYSAYSSSGRLSSGLTFKILSIIDDDLYVEEVNNKKEKYRGVHSFTCFTKDSELEVKKRGHPLTKIFSESWTG